MAALATILALVWPNWYVAFWTIFKLGYELLQ